MTTRQLGKIGLLCFVGFAAIAGLLGRIAGLGSAPLAIDEYFLAQSIANLLLHGLPQFDCGGFYTRGLLHQYASALLQLSGASPESALRIVSVVANVSVIPAMYLVGSRLAGRESAVIAVGLFLLSIWEIEFARFGRMYAPFQAIFAWFVWFFLQSMDGKQRAFFVGLILAFASVAVYEAGAVLLLLCAIPLLSGQIRGAVPWVSTITAVTVSYAFLSRNFRNLGAEPSLPPDLAALPSGDLGWSLPIDKPFFFIEFISYSWLLGIVLGSVAFMAYLVHHHRRTRGKAVAESTDIPQYLWITIAVVGPVLNLFGLVATVALVFFLFRWITPPLVAQRTHRLIGSWYVLWLVLWSSIALLYPDSHVSEIASAKDIIRALFLYPDFYSEVGYRWFMSMPVATILLATAIVAGLAFLYRSSDVADRFNDYALVVGATLASLVLVTVLPQPYASIRYTFYIYPVVLVCATSAVTILASTVITGDRTRLAVVCAIVVLYTNLAEDIDLRHIRDINSEDTTFRTNMDKWRQDLVYRRWDYRSPSEFINSRIKPGETVLTTVHSAPFYLDRTDYFFRDASSSEFIAISACRGTLERWSNAQLLYHDEDFDAVVHSVGDGHGIWLLTRSVGQEEAWPVERQFADLHAEKLQFNSRDGRLSVYYIAP